MQNEHFMVTGMTCSGCTSKVSRALNAVAGVDDVNVSLADGEATVRFNERLTSIEQLKSAVKNAVTVWMEKCDQKAGAAAEAVPILMPGRK